MKILLVLASLASSTANVEAPRETPSVTYNVTGSQPLGAWRTPSCGAQQRMLKDKHMIRFDGHDVIVNRTKWHLDEGTLPGSATISFHADEKQFTYLTMELYANGPRIDGTYTLFGLTSKNERCMDKVSVSGSRR